MAYVFKEAANAMSIGEAEYVTGVTGSVRLVNISSCAGIILLGADSKLSAAHLVRTIGNTEFGQAQEMAIKLLLPKEWVAVAFVGRYNEWLEDNPAHEYTDPRGGRHQYALQPKNEAFERLYNYFTKNGTMTYPSRNELPGAGAFTATPSQEIEDDKTSLGVATGVITKTIAVTNS